MGSLSYGRQMRHDKCKSKLRLDKGGKYKMLHQRLGVDLYVWSVLLRQQMLNRQTLIPQVQARYNLGPGTGGEHLRAACAGLGMQSRC